MKLSTTILAVVATSLLSCGLFSQQAQANTMQLTYGSRHSGNGGEFNASSPDFAPGTMGYNAAKTIYNGGFETKEPSMAAFLVAILISFPGERRGST